MLLEWPLCCYPGPPTALPLPLDCCWICHRYCSGLPSLGGMISLSGSTMQSLAAVGWGGIVAVVVSQDSCIGCIDYCHFPIWDTGHMRIWGRFSTPICALRRSFNGLPRGISASYVAKGVFGPPLCRHFGNPISALFYILRTHFWGPLAPFLSRPPSIFCPRPGRFRQWIF